jgi:hypothetical protein
LGVPVWTKDLEARQGVIPLASRPMMDEYAYR